VRTTTKPRSRVVGTVVLVAALTLGLSAVASALPTRGGGYYFLTDGLDYQLTTLGHRTLIYTFTIQTGSSHEVFVRNIGRNGPGLHLLTSSEWKEIRIIPPHESISVTMKYRVNNCAKVPKGNWPLAFEASWYDGKWYPVRMQMQGAGTQQWQQSLVSFVCGQNRPSIRP
jgi:hypothetical protein